MRIRTITAAILALFLVPALASGQEEKKKDGEKKIKVEVRTEAETKRGEKKGKPNHGTVVSAVNRLDAEIDELAAIESLSAADLRVVRVDDVVTEGDEALAVALARQEARVAGLRDWLADGDVEIVAEGDTELTFESWLAAHGLTVSDVIAADVNGGKVTLFVEGSSTVSSVQ